MKKIILILILIIPLFGSEKKSTVSADEVNKNPYSKTKTANRFEYPLPTNRREYSLSANSYYLNEDPEFMGKAMHFAYQEYSGLTAPVIMYPTYGYIRKNAGNSLSFINITSKRIMKAKIFFRGTGSSEDKDLLISFDTFDFVSGSNCTVKLHNSFLQDNVYTIDKIVFYYDDLSEQTVQADELYSERALAPLDLTGSGIFFIDDPNTGSYNFIVKTYSSDSESTGTYKITATKEDGKEINVEGGIPYLIEGDIFLTDLWSKIAIEELCNLKKLEIEFSSTNDTVLREEVTDSVQLDKITMWVSAFNYYGYR